jgi:hypothetical protein
MVRAVLEPIVEPRGAAEKWSSPRVSVAAARATAARAAARAAAARAVAVRAAAKAVAAKAAVARAWIQVHVASLAGPARSLDAVCTGTLHARSDAVLDATATLFLQLASQDRVLAPAKEEVADPAEAALFFEADALCTERLPAASGSCLHDAASLFLQLAPGDCSQARATGRATPVASVFNTPVGPQTPCGARIITTSRDHYGPTARTRDGYGPAAATALTPTAHTCERSRRGGRAGGADVAPRTISEQGGRTLLSLSPAAANAPRSPPRGRGPGAEAVACGAAR